MKKLNKLVMSIGLFYIVLHLFSCTSNNGTINSDPKSDVTLIVKKWILTDNLTTVSPTMVILSIEKNGYFQIYDTIIDSKFAEAGISKIQPISKGQWKIEKNKLILTHFSPEEENPTIFVVNYLSADKMIIMGANKEIHTYKAK